MPRAAVVRESALHDLTGMTPDEAQAAMRRTWSEAYFQAKVIAEAKANGFLVYHTHTSRHSEAGFPDLCMVRDDGRLIFAELKREGKEPTKAQETWLALLRLVDASPVEVYVWRPSDWPDIQEVLA